LRTLRPDGSGNAVYDNGTFGFSVAETWNQLTVGRTSLAVDWRSNFWGPVTFIPCSVGTANGHLSYGAPDPDPGTNFPIPRGPVSRELAYAGSGNDIIWCGNDRMLVNAPLYEQPNLYFNAPPPIFGGLLSDSTWGCNLCDLEQLENAASEDSARGTPYVPGTPRQQRFGVADGEGRGPPPCRAWDSVRLGAELQLA
jgi:hypothetical protein